MVDSGSETFADRVAALQVRNVELEHQLQQYQARLQQLEAQLADRATPPAYPPFRQVVDNAPFLLWMADVDGNCSFFNQTWLTFRGRSLTQETGTGWTAGIHPDDVVQCLGNYSAAVRARQPIVLEYRLQRADGAYRWLLNTGVPWFLPDGTCAGYIGSAVEISDRKQAEAALLNLNAELEQKVAQRTQELSDLVEALRDSEARYRAIVEDQTELICRFRSDYTLTFVNQAYCRYYNQPLESLLNGSFLPLIPADEQGFVLASLATLSSAQPVVSYEHQIILPTGEQRWHYWTVRLICNRQGQIIEYQGVGRDVTAQKLAETKLKVSLAEKEVLLREIHHRVKNNLQMISSLLSLKVRSIQDPQMLAPLIESQHRIHTMALIHEKLYSATNLAQIDFAEYVHSLAADLFRSAMVASNVSLQTEVARIELPVDTVISCGLIINELVANAIKHAFPTGQPGGVLIRFTADPNDRYTLTVQDNGIGLPADLELDRSPSLGLRLVCALTNKLRGTIELERHHGTCFRITFSSSRCEKIT